MLYCCAWRGWSQASGSDALVGEEQCSAVERLRGHEPQLDVTGRFSEERYSPSQRDGVNDQVVFIDETQPYEIMHQRCAASHDDVLAGLLLQARHLFRNIGRGEAGIAPVEPFQGPGENDLGDLVEERRHLVARIPELGLVL